MRILIPSEAVCLLEYYYLPSGNRLHCTEGPSTAIERLLELGLVENPDPGGAWTITAKGQAHVYHMLHVPLPVSKWVLPITVDEDSQK